MQHGQHLAGVRCRVLSSNSILKTLQVPGKWLLGDVKPVFLLVSSKNISSSRALEQIISNHFIWLKIEFLCVSFLKSATSEVSRILEDGIV